MTTSPQSADPVRGVLIMLAGIALFSVLNGVVKAQSEHFPITQIMFFRNAFALLPLVFLLHRSGGRDALDGADYRHHIALALLFTLTLFFIFGAYARLPLADATAIAFSQPLIVFVLASLLALERANLLGWCSVGLGLVGVLLMVQPSGTGDLMGYAFALIGSFFGAASMLVQRNLALKENAVVIAFFTLGISALISAPLLAIHWVTPTGPQLLGLVTMGMASGLCQLVITYAFVHAAPALIAPVTYTKMLWAVIIGYVWFGDWPSVEILIGASIVLAAAALTLKAAQSPPPLRPDP